jgi:hypothetical protein
MPTVIYSNLSKIEFTEEDIAATIAARRESAYENGSPEVKTLATLSIDEFIDGQVPQSVLVAFAKLADAIGVKAIGKTYNAMTINRPLTAQEERASALYVLRNGQTDAAAEIRALRATEQDIRLYKDDGE